MFLVILISLVLSVFFHFFFFRYLILKIPLMICATKDCAVLPLPTELILKEILIGTKHSQTYLIATLFCWLSLV